MSFYLFAVANDEKLRSIINNIWSLDEPLKKNNASYLKTAQQD